MFTGIIEDLGTAAAIQASEDGARIEIDCSITDGLTIGDSVAVNGVCLTAVAVTTGRLAFDVVLETLDRSNLGAVEVGDRINLERAMPAAGRFDGHIVQGHVDGRGTVAAVESEGDGVRISIDVDSGLSRYIVEKGSITVNGVSLTVAALTGEGFQVALIPHTLEVTNLSALRSGATVNLEVDVIAKYVERILERRL